MLNFGLKDIIFDIADDSTTSIGADVALLSEDDNLGEVNHPDEVTEEVEEEVDPLLTDDEEVTAEEVEEAPEIKDLHPFERPSIAQINEKFPDIFKTFPALKDMYFREAEYSRVFPTIDEAKEAAENNEAFTNIRGDIFSGDGTKFLSAVKEVDEKGLGRFAANFLPSLIKLSPDSFWRAANPLVEDVARNMFQKGTRDKDENMQNAARYLSEYFFGSTEVAEGKKTTVIKDEAKDPEVAKEREEYELERYTEFRGGVSNTIRADLKSVIDNEKLDPKKIFSPFIKSTIIDRIVKDIEDQLQSDKDHIRFMTSLWNRANKNGRTDEDKARIVSAYLARAKSLIPSIRSKYVSEALGQRQRTSEEKKRIATENQNRRDAGSQGRSSGARKENYDPKAIDYRKSSDMDILNDNISYKN
jgi:hypothetical protein